MREFALCAASPAPVHASECNKRIVLRHRCLLGLTSDELRQHRRAAIRTVIPSSAGAVRPAGAHRRTCGGRLRD